MIRLLIADDHALFREGLKRIFAEYDDLVVAGEASNGMEVLSQVCENDYDVVLLDISMPGRSGIDIIKQLKALEPEIRVLVLSMYSEEQYAFRALKAGASGYLTKNGASRDLINAIRKVSTGGKFISAAVAEQIAFDLEKGADEPPHKGLSDREFQVLCMIASGKTVKEIADELSLSVKTISTYRTRILEKMHMKNNAEITCYAIRNGLVV
ncbi:MAG: response regulator [bacterium]